MGNFKFAQMFTIVCVLLLSCATLWAIEADVLVVFPQEKGSVWATSREIKEAKAFFRSDDVLASYADGSALIFLNEKTMKVIKENELSVDPSLTSPERYNRPLANDDQVESFLSSSLSVQQYEASKPAGDGFFIVQFQGPILQDWLTNLEESGVRILSPLPPYGYLVWGEMLDENLRAYPEVRSAAPIVAVRKLSGSLLSWLLMAEKENPDAFHERRVSLSILIAETYENQAVAARDALLKIEGISEMNFTQTPDGYYFSWQIDTLAANIPLIANYSDVFYIELLDKSQLCGERELILGIGKFDATGDGPLQGASYERWLADKGVNGAGVTVQCVDTGLDRGNATNMPGTVHTDVLGRVAGVVDYSGDKDGIDNNGHGTLNAGIIAGNPFTRLQDPGAYLVGMGVSPKSKIFATKVSNSTSFQFKETYETMTQEARSFGASISLQPWGVSTRTFNPMTGDFSPPPAYSDAAARFDRLTRVANGDNMNPLPMLFVFAAGNNGWFCDMFGCYLVEQSLANPAFAKNIISVGAFTGAPPEGGKRRDPVINTSRGTTGDGRFAPTLVAPGVGISGMASQSDGYQNGPAVFYPLGQTLYTRGNGTSHAAAQVAGAAALFSDWWQRFNNYASVPSPALIKAALINSTEDQQGGDYPVYIPDGMLGMGEPVYAKVDFAPDMNQGWGGLNLDKLIPDKGKENNYIFIDQGTQSGSILDANGKFWETTIYAIDNDTPMFITLVWTDPAASSSAGKALVNDLDLIVTNGADQVIYGNTFSKGWSGISASGDRVNNVEVVKIKNPYGAYKVKVRAVSLAGKILPNDSINKQDFALAVRGATLASPKGMVSFTAQYYKCDSTAGIILADLDLKDQGTKTITVINKTHAATLDVTLTENPPKSGVFLGNFNIVSTPAAGKLAAVHGDMLEITYNDADDGTGKAAVSTSRSYLDCESPRVTNFVVSDFTAFSLTLNFSLNKKASGILKYGTSTSNLNISVPLEDVSLLQTIKMAGLNPCTIYYAQLELVDAVGNAFIDNNAGAFYSFQTLDDKASFFDDLDVNYSQTNFTHAAIQGTDDWERIDETANSYSPTHSMRTQSVASVKDIYLKTKNVALQPFSRLTFYHKFYLEPGFDGAVAEISTDNGKHWRDLGNQIVQGKYTAMIALFSGNPLMARLAWTYAWDNGKVEFRRSWIDLDKYRGKPAIIRFRLATDDSIVLPNSAWYVDDVKISYDADCQNGLFMRMSRSNYGPDESVTITVFDPSLPSAASVNVNVSSETEPAGETVALTRIAANKYSGAISTKNLGAAAGDGKISCADGNIITALYSSSANGGNFNPDQAKANAFYRLPSLIFSPPLNEGTNKLNNNLQNALVFPIEMTAVGANIILDSVKFSLVAGSSLVPSRDIAPNGVKLYEDTNDDRAFTEDANPDNADVLIATASIGDDGTVIFPNLNYTVSRDNSPRLFLLVDLTDQIPFGARFQFEIPNLATDLVAKLADNTPIIAKSERPPQGLKIKIISRAYLVNQNAPTIYIEDGETWETAYHFIGDALKAAKNRAMRGKTPVEVWVARGRYKESLSEKTSAPIYSNIHLYGGFGGAEANKDAPRLYITQTMIEVPHCDETPRSDFDTHDWYNNRLIDMYGGSVIDGFHITASHNFNIHSNDFNIKMYGIYCIAKDALPVKIRNCIIRNIPAFAIHANNSNACPNSIVSNCVFAWLWNQPVAYLGLGSMFVNCSFYNVAEWDIRGANYFFYNSAWESTVHYGSYWNPGAHLLGGSDEFNRVRNCILPYGVRGVATIFGDDRGNKKESPKFINPDGLDFRLQPGSPGIDAGRSEDNTEPRLAAEFPPLDIRGDNRIIGSAPDVGVCELTPGKAMYYIKSVSYGNEGDPQPIIFRPDQPVPIRLSLGAYNQPGDLITLGGRLFFTDRQFKVDRNMGLFAPTDIGSLEQIRNLPFSIILTGNPTIFYEMNVFVDFLKTDGTNQVLDTAFFNFTLPAFVDPVNGSDDNKDGYPEFEPANSGGIRQPFKSIGKAFFYLRGHTFNEDLKIYVAKGTVKDQIWTDPSRRQFYWPTTRVEIYGGFNPRTWERNPKVFETIWTGENQRRFVYSRNALAYKLDGFTFKEGVEQSLEILHDDYHYYFSPNDITNNIFQNVNGNSIIRLQSYITFRWFDNNGGLMRSAPIWSTVGAPLSNAPNNGSVLLNWRSSENITIPNIKNNTFTEATIECWFNPRSLVLNKPDYWRTADLLKIYIDGYNFIYLTVSDSKKLQAHFMQTGWDWFDGQKFSDTKEIETGVWHHAAFVIKKDAVDPTTYHGFLYHNGELVAVHVRKQRTPFSLTPTNAFFNLDGSIDEVRIWNRPLGADEILANRDKEVRSGNGLVCAFHFDEQKGVYSVSSAGDYKAGPASAFYDDRAILKQGAVQSEPVFNVSSNTFMNNKAISVELYNGAMPTLIHNNIFKNNQNMLINVIGGYWASVSHLQVTNNVMMENVTPNNIALIILKDTYFNQWFLNNTIINNTAKVFKAAVADGNGNAYGAGAVVNNIIRGNSGGIDDNTDGVQDVIGRYVYNLIDDAGAADPMINPAWAMNYTCADPKFDADKWHLTAGSCAIGKGPAINQSSPMPLAAIGNPVTYFSDADPAIFTSVGGATSLETWGVYWGGKGHQITQAPITCTWIIAGLEPARYEVQAYIADYNWNDVNLTYTVFHKNGQNSVNISQGANRGKWASLGVYELNSTANMKVQMADTRTGGVWIMADDVRVIYRPDIPPVGTTAPPSAFIAHNFWNLDKDIDGQERPEGSAWDSGADQFAGEGAAVVKANLLDGSARLAGIPFGVELKLTRNYNRAPSGFAFRVQYPAGTVTGLTAQAGTLGATPTVGAEQPAGGGKVSRLVSAIPGNTANTERNPQLVKLNITVADPYPQSLAIEILPPASGFAVQDAAAAEIPVTIDASLLAGLQILSPNPIANFSAVPTRGLVNPDVPLFLSVFFQDASIGYVTSWEWDFGDGITSIDRNPIHEYIATGTYTVTLTVQGPYGKSTKIRQDYIVASDPRNPPEANFTGEPFNTQTQRVEGPAPLRVEFLDATNGPTSTFVWTFGDGQTSNAQNPTHIYQNQGTYTVTFKVDGPMGDDTETKTGYVHVTAPLAPQASFSVDSAIGFAPHDVQFSNQSTGSNIQFYYYDFGDGKWSQKENPSHQFIMPGNYNSRLTIAGATGFSVSPATKIEVRQAFPHKYLAAILIGRQAVTPEDRQTLDFNKDSKLDAADIVFYLQKNR